jgi:hypothetical protein
LSTTNTPVGVRVGWSLGLEVGADAVKKRDETGISR